MRWRVTRRACDTVSKSFGNRYGRFAGSIKGLPADLASNHDHYLAMKKPVLKVAKSAKSKPVKPDATPSDVRIVAPSMAEVMAVLQSRATEASTLFGERLLAMQTRASVLQEDIGYAAQFGSVAKTCSGASDSFRALCVTMRTADPAERLVVEHGPRALSWTDNRRVTLAWKDETMKLAQVLYAVAQAHRTGNAEQVEKLLTPFQGVFNEEVFEAALKKDKKPKGSLSVAIVEGI